MKNICHIKNPKDLIKDSLNEAAEMNARQINMNANENSLSKTALQFLTTSYESFYELSEPGTKNVSTDATTMKGSLMYRHLPELQKLIESGRKTIEDLLCAEYVDMRPLSGVHAMECTLLALTEPGDIIWSLSPENAGHFATRHIILRAGRISEYIPWDSEIFDIDFEKFKNLVDRNGQPNLIFLDHSLALYPLSIKKLRTLCPESIIVYDGSHTLGLILGGAWANPFLEGADIIQGNTHKTFPGPQKALIATRAKTHTLKLQMSLNQGLLSSQHTHHTAALAVTALEMQQYANEYAALTVRNARLMARLLKCDGFRILENSDRQTNSHIVFALPPDGIDAYEACRRLQRFGIACNARPIMNTNWLRFGTQNISRRGAKSYEIFNLCMIISRIIRGAPHVNDKFAILHMAEQLKNISFSFDRIISEENIYEKTIMSRFDSFVS